MAISDRITSIEEHIKESYQELEGIGIDTTGVDKNLENIPKLIDGYWETLPKVTGEGTAITLDNTKEGKMKINLKGNTSQATTTQSKNLMPNKAESQTLNGLTITKGADGSLLINGTSTATTKIELGTTNLASGTYTLSTHKEGTVDNSCYLRTIDTTTESEISGTSFNIYNSNSKTYTLSENKKVKFDFYTGGSRTFTNFKIYPMAESGSTATDYVEFVPNSPSPDYPQDIHVVSGDNTIKIEGKNILHLSNTSVTNGGITGTITNDNILTYSGTATRGYADITSTTAGVTLQTGTYIFSIDQPQNFRVVLYGIGGNNIITAGNTQISIIVSEERQFNYRVGLTGLASGTAYSGTIKMQLEKSSTRTEYKSYQSQSYPISLGDIELCKIGNYQDSIVKDNGKWYLNKQIGKYTFTGNETLTAYSGGKSRKIVNLINGYTTANNIAPLGYSELSLMASRISIYNETNYGISYNSNEVYIRLADKVGQDLLDLLEGTSLYYILATPTYTEITDSTLLSQLNALARSYSSQTNISQESNDLASILNATALGEM